MYCHSLLGLLNLSLLCVTSLALYTGRREANNPADVQMYFNLNAAAHDIRVRNLKEFGYRIISLSSYGTPPNINYAAVWIKREGSPFEAIFNADAKAYDDWVKSWRSKGYVSTHVSATGSANSAVYAGVMEQANVGRWKQICGLKTPNEFDSTRDPEMVIKYLSTYGTPTDPRYCVLGHENIGNEMETIFHQTETPFEFAEIYESELKKPFWRPSHLFISDDHIITPHFVNNWVGKWVAKTDLTAEQLAAEIEAQKEQGRLYPIDLHGGATGTDIRFTVIFAETDVPEARKWTVTGNEADPDAAEALDQVMRTWMRKNGVRQAQVAAASKGEIIIERSYTWAESNRAIVQPDDVFLLASLSKMFVHAAIFNLIEAGKLEYSTRVYPLLGYTQPSDTRALDITINHLLTHSTGSDRSKSGDTGFEFRKASLYFYDGEHPANLRDMIEYQLTKKLDFNPGARFSYSNYGTMLLGYVVSNITKQPYLDFLRENILGNLDVRLYETAAEKHANDRIIQETRYTGYDPTNPNRLQRVPGNFGGDGAIKEECASAFSLAASASTIARFIGTHAVWGTGGRSVGKRQGMLSGARAFATSESSGIDWAITLNTRDFISEQEVLNLRFKLLQPLFKKPDSCFTRLGRLCFGT